MAQFRVIVTQTFPINDIELITAAALKKLKQRQATIALYFESTLHLLDGFHHLDSHFMESHRTVSDDVGLVDRAEAEVVQREQRQAPVLRHICQDAQGLGHLEDALLAVLCERQVDQQPQPQAQQAAAATRRRLSATRFGRRHGREGLQELALWKTWDEALRVTRRRGASALLIDLTHSPTPYVKLASVFLEKTSRCCELE